MWRTSIRKIVDPLLALTLLMQLTTGLLMARAEGHEEAEQIVPLHVAGGLALVALVVVHVIVNWPIVRATWGRR